MKTLATLILAAGLVSVDLSAGSRLEITDYDPYFRRAAARWMPDYEWQWLAAQCFQESRFRPRAVSPAGARGLCQFMSPTWADARRALGVRDVYSASENVWAAGWYMRTQLAIWSAPRTDRQRLELAQAGYNAGAGNILAAQRLCGPCPTWDEIGCHLPDVTGRHARETLDYVRKIAAWKDRIGRD